MNEIPENRRFSIIARAKSFTHAFRGLGIMIRTQHNAWIHFVVAGFVAFFGFVFNITSLEWILAIFAIGLVIIAEAFNTAMEIDINLTSPTYHPYARDTKDVAAGAVLIAVIVAMVIGTIIFLPKILKIF